ncbi:DUF6221 family protein [Blastococcus sp. CCUG 61487]|uniref:DUF6221 family protein n=1 Tax=Blastococcus sp. CCUG 61487 TaxID=1840703 RepID=UPI0010C01542|nr:DUF6221 family protein [Blastococcus sp. CCUG 61487]TKJ25233.1 hypothetical protein A6V29_04215 [Blastococcus sp. CCUG 61487]
MTALAEFLLARFTEDEERAREASQRGSRWQESGAGVWAQSRHIVASDGTLPRSGYGVADVDGQAVAHVLAWDPARVLAECDAKRLIVDQFRHHEAGVLIVRGDPINYRSALLFALRALALPYADHPDYQEEWRLA